MIYRIVNLAEVEQGIREVAERRALASQIFPTYRFAEALCRDRVRLEASLLPAGNFGRDAWDALPPFERDRIVYFALSVIAKTISDERERMLDNFIDGRAEALLCNVCGARFGEPIHQQWDDAGHRFVCAHGTEVGLPAECIMDHPDVVP